jgi:hypothetical protein
MLRLTVDCTIEQSISSTATVVVDSGTQAGSHVPVGDFRNILYRDGKAHNRESVQDVV